MKHRNVPDGSQPRNGKETNWPRHHHDGSSQNIRRAGWDPRDVAGKQNYKCQQMKHRKALDGVGIPGTLLGDTKLQVPAYEALRNP